jgi:hypothetical protein
MERITRDVFRETVRQARKQHVSLLEIAAEVVAVYVETYEPSPDGTVLEPGGGGFGGGGASGKW